MSEKTPLEQARERLLQPKIGTCLNCTRFVVIDNIGYCEESGKILLSMFLDGKRDCCVWPEPRQYKPAIALQSELAAANEKMAQIRELWNESMKYGITKEGYSGALQRVMRIINGGETE